MISLDGLTDWDEYLASDFYQPTVRRGERLFFRQIFHSWPDPSCVEILKVLIPALKTGAKVVVNDHLAPPPNTIPLL